MRKGFRGLEEGGGLLLCLCFRHDFGLASTGTGTTGTFLTIRLFFLIKNQGASLQLRDDGVCTTRDGDVCVDLSFGNHLQYPTIPGGL